MASWDGAAPLVRELQAEVAGLRAQLAALQATVANGGAGGDGGGDGELAALRAENFALRLQLHEYRIADRAGSGGAVRELSRDVGPSSTQPPPAAAESPDAAAIPAGESASQPPASPPLRDPEAPPPEVTVFPQGDTIWVGYRYPNSRGIVGYEVRAGTELSDPETIACPTGPHRWRINGAPQTDSRFHCSTGKQLKQLHVGFS